MWAISLLSIVLVFPLLSAAPLDIAGGVKDDDGMHSHDENVTRGGKFFGHNQFDVGNINVPGSVEGDDVSIGHQVNIDVQGYTHDHHHQEDDTGPLPLPLPAYLGIPGFQKCLGAKSEGSSSVLCFPFEKPAACNPTSWEKLMTLQKEPKERFASCGSLPPVPLPAYLSVPGFQKCLGAKSEGSSSVWCFPFEKPAACNPISWEKLMTLQKEPKERFASCAPCSGTDSDWDCCSKTSPCKLNEGDCDTDDDCVGSLVCGKDNCRSINPLAYQLADCCIQPGIIVDGGWSAWSSWSDCIGICGQTKTRTRACSSTAGDKSCPGATTQTVGCDLPSCSKGQSSPLRPEQKVCHGNGLFRDRDDCSVFYQCDGDVITKFQCPPKTSFDPAGRCDWTENVDCDKYPDYDKKTPDNDDKTTEVIPTLLQVQAMEEKLTSSEMMKMVKHSIRTLDTNLVDKIAPGLPQNPENVKRVEAILKESDFEYLFPKRDKLYTYRKFLQAIGKFPAICGTYKESDSDLICKKTLITMFAHFTQETGGHNPGTDVEEWRQGLVWLREMNCYERSPGCGYNGECESGIWQSEAWPCGTNSDGTWKQYFGRGAKQLSYNYNYGPFSDAIFGTVRTLLDEPSIVADTWLSLASAMWFFVYPQPPKPSMLFVLDGTWQPNKEDLKNGLEAGLGATIMIINGGIECGGEKIPQAINRKNYYKKFSEYFKVDIEGEELSCANMKQFTSGGSGSLPIYWEKNWSWPTNYQCMLVDYQTAYTAFKKGDYVKCVQDKFDVFLN